MVFIKVFKKKFQKPLDFSYKVHYNNSIIQYTHNKKGGEYIVGKVINFPNRQPIRATYQDFLRTFDEHANYKLYPVYKVKWDPADKSDCPKVISLIKLKNPYIILESSGSEALFNWRYNANGERESEYCWRPELSAFLQEDGNCMLMAFKSELPEKAYQLILEGKLRIAFL